jgi:DNA-binding SARP family transcriptional activator
VFELRLLGGQGGRGGSFRLAGPEQRAVLAMLLVEGDRVPAELIAALWRDAEPRAGAAVNSIAVVGTRWTDS